MARIEEYLKMNTEQLEEAITREKARIKKARTEIALLEKLKIANQNGKGSGERDNYGNGANENHDDFHQQ